VTDSAIASGHGHPSTDDGAAHRVLVVSADMGAGHNATAAALEEAVRASWPGSDVLRIDALDVMGPGVGSAFRRIYVGNVETTPWLYEFFYASLWRHRWFSRASKRFTGEWCGRRLAAHIDRFDPDLILSTYPLGSAGLAWLRKHRGLDVVTAGWVSDFAPHPFWVYPELDANFVMDRAAVAVARAAEPAARVLVSALPVIERFRPGDQQRARAELDLPPDRLIVLISCGSYAFGDTDAMVTTACAAATDVTVVAVCGRDETARARLQRLGIEPSTLVVYGWVDTMPTLVQAADLVVTNAGGATALEALASGTPLVYASPIAAHGTANADLMTVSGSSELCSDLDHLRNLVATAAEDRTTLRPVRERIAAHRVDDALPEALRSLASDTAQRHARTMTRPWPMRAADAFFAHVEAAGPPQEVGVVLEIDRLPDGRQLTGAAFAAELQRRLAGLPPLRRVLSRRPLGWRLRDQVDAREQVAVIDLPEAQSMSDLWRAVSTLWHRPLDGDRPAWQMVLVGSPALRRSLVGMKLHHSLGDGISALGVLDRLLDPDPTDRLVERRRASARRRTGRRRHMPAVLTGVYSLAARGTAPRHPLNHRTTAGSPEVVGVALPWPEVRRLADSLDARPPELLLALLAQALTTLLGDAGQLSANQPLRAMVPVAMRAPRLDRVFGNWTGSVSLDLPTRPMPLAERVRLVREEMRRRVGRGEAEGAQAVLRLAGCLPTPLHRWFAATVYSNRFFNTVVSFMPAARGPRRLAGAPVRLTVPVLPLTRAVPVTIGIIVADQTVGVGVLMDDSLGLQPQAVEAAVREAYASAGGQLNTAPPTVPGALG
jgi:diacylglycerol O-acyltransferase / wax synthase